VQHHPDDRFVYEEAVAFSLEGGFALKGTTAAHVVQQTAWDLYWPRLSSLTVRRAFFCRSPERSHSIDVSGTEESRWRM
jgi:hypothetical protein